MPGPKRCGTNQTVTVLVALSSRGWHSNNVVNQCNIGLRQRSAVQRCAVRHRNGGTGQYVSLEYNVRSQRGLSADLPKDVGRHGTIFQEDVGVNGCRQSSRNLEDVDAGAV
jgi:hypothetical protein